MASSECVKDVFRKQRRSPNWCNSWTRCRIKQFTAMCSNRKPMTGPMIIENSKPFYDEVKIKDKGTFFQGSNKNYL